MRMLISSRSKYDRPMSWRNTDEGRRSIEEQESQSDVHNVI